MVIAAREIVFSVSTGIKEVTEKMVLNTRVLLILAAVIAGAVITVGSAFAQGNSGSTKPGWGYGDQNHVHTGPPGQSVRPVH